MKWEEHDWYETPLYYDLIYGADTRLEADLLEAVWRRFGPGRGRVAPRLLEPACGSGRLVVEMARRGWRVEGFDASAAMLGYARRRLERGGLRARLWQDRMESFAAGFGRRFDMAHCLINTFRYLLTEEAARSFLGRVGRLLVPGGIFVLGLHLTDYRRRRCEHERWTARAGKVSVVCNTRTWPADRRRRIEKLRTRLVVLRGGRTERLETCWEYRTYSAGQLTRLLRSALPGFRMLACFDFTCDPESSRPLGEGTPDCIVALQKPR